MKNFGLFAVALTLVLAACTGQDQSIVVSQSRSMAKMQMTVAPLAEQQDEQYLKVDPNPVKQVSQAPVSTFSADVDTTSYAVMRRYLQRDNALPPSASVRVEEMVNYFDYDYPAAASADQPFKPTVWVTPSPWRDGAQLMHIGIKGYDLQPEHTPAVNFVFLLDVSGSMKAANKLPLIKKSIKLMLKQMGPDDTVSIVVYAGAAGTVLEPTNATKIRKINKALNALSAGGSTAGGEGIELAYSLAEENFEPEKINRIILATDGDFNVGIHDPDQLEDLIVSKRDKGIYLTVLGVGDGNYNDVIAQTLAQKGNGIAAYIDKLDEARKVLVRDFRSTVFPIANDVKFQVEFNPAVVAEYRLIGYETRLLREEDFNNDAVDAGDTGSGHTVTAIYEIVTVGSKARQIDPSRYADTLPPNKTQDEFAFVKLRYKVPGSDTSELITYPVRVADAFQSLEDAPKDARFAAAVAAFGQKMQRAEFTKAMSYKDIIALADATKGSDTYGTRSEFVQLVRSAAAL
ncbi:MAG: VWA domain-containing protein [Parvularculaceae bacterium]